MSISDKYAELERLIRDRKTPIAPAIVPLEQQVEEEFRAVQKWKRPYSGLSKKERNHG